MVFFFINNLIIISYNTKGVWFEFCSPRKKEKIIQLNYKNLIIVKLFFKSCIYILIYAYFISFIIIIIILIIEKENES